MVEIFSQMTDFRMDRSKKHKLVDIITIAICATTAGAEGYNEIEDWGLSKEPWLSKFLDLPYGIPSHDTFRRVFGLLRADVFQDAFLQWVSSVNALLDNRLISIDGKTLRRSFDKTNNKRALHLVSAWASEAKLSLGQIQVDEKSNEITAIPELIKILELKGAIVTLDAMGTQKKISHDLVEAGADYVLALKANHGDLYDDVATYFKLEPGTSFIVETSLEKDHGRIEKRIVSVSKTTDWLSHKKEWANLQSVIQVIRTRDTVLGTCKTTHYYLSTLPVEKIETIARAIRSHWSIENSLHWSLDVLFNEDQCRIRDKNAASNLSLMRKMAISMLKATKEHAGKSLKRKKFLASLDDAFLLNLIGVKLN